jgi:hypothetical protein
MTRMTADRIIGRIRAFFSRRVTAIAAAAVVAVAAAVMIVGHGVAFAASRPAGTAAATPTLTFGTLMTNPDTAAAEAQAGVSNAMLELSWASSEPQPGVFNTSYLASVKNDMAAFQAAGMHVTLALGLYNPPSWVFSLPDGTYVDQDGNRSTEANFVYSQAVRVAAAKYLSQVNAVVPLSGFADIRVTSGGDGEMLYPSGGTYWAFDTAALTGQGLAAGMTPNPFPNWRPGQSGLTQAQTAQWVSWYVGGLDNVTKWQIQTLNWLGFGGYYETVTPGSGTRPDALTDQEAQNLPDGVTGVGAVWNLYYAQLWNRNRVMAYQSSMADQSGGNDGCQASDTALPLTSGTMDSWSATRWIARIGHQYGLLVGGENPGYGMPASLDSFYTNTTSTGMMAVALNQARTCGFSVFYWAHDYRLYDGTVPFAAYARAISSSPTITGTHK